LCTATPVIEVLWGCAAGGAVRVTGGGWRPELVNVFVEVYAKGPDLLRSGPFVLPFQRGGGRQPSRYSARFDAASAFFMAFAISR
jgi:hypothetical protein